MSATMTMDAGRREDLKAIWDDVSKWVVEGFGESFVFTKQLGGEEYKRRRKNAPESVKMQRWEFLWPRIVYRFIGWPLSYGIDTVYVWENLKDFIDRRTSIQQKVGN